MPRFKIKGLTRAALSLDKRPHMSSQLSRLSNRAITRAITSYKPTNLKSSASGAQMRPNSSRNSAHGSRLNNSNVNGDLLGVLSQEIQLQLTSCYMINRKTLCLQRKSREHFPNLRVSHRMHRAPHWATTSTWKSTVSKSRFWSRKSGAWPTKQQVLDPKYRFYRLRWPSVSIKKNSYRIAQQRKLFLHRK